MESRVSGSPRRSREPIDWSPSSSRCNRAGTDRGCGRGSADIILRHVLADEIAIHCSECARSLADRSDKSATPGEGTSAGVKPPVNDAARPALGSKDCPPAKTSAMDRSTAVISSTNLWRGSRPAFSSARSEYVAIALASRRIMLPTGSAREPARRQKHNRCEPRCACASPDWLSICQQLSYQLRGRLKLGATTDSYGTILVGGLSRGSEHSVTVPRRVRNATEDGHPNLVRFPRQVCASRWRRTIAGDRCAMGSSLKGWTNQRSVVSGP